MGLRLITALLILTVNINVFAQKNSYYKRVFVDAEYFLLYEEYNDALPLYQELHKAYPSNCNYDYRIGLCYLNTPGQKQKAVQYLAAAINNTNSNYKEGFFTENKAPLEAYLYYGKALRIQHQFDKADSVLNTYKTLLMQENESTIIVDRELESIALARQMMASPKPHTITSVGRNINTQNSETHPISDSSGRTMIYTSVQKFYNAILISHKDTGFWKNPTNLNTQLLADGEIRTVGISPGGNVLILARNDNDTYHLYYSHFDKSHNTWAPITRFPKEINSRNDENYGSLTQNADTLYFSSRRPGGYGGFDIYYSVKNAEGNWSNPINMGSKVNTCDDEIAPLVSKNGNKLFFSSNGHKTMGGYDLFYSNRYNQEWQTPINFGYPINTCDDDIYLFPIGNGNEAFFHREMDDTKGGTDIYHVKIYYQ